MSVNKAILVGRVGKDAELVGNETKVAKFSLATTEVYKNKQGEKVENVEWHNIVLFGGMAENLWKYLTKGTQIFLEGKIVTSNYETKEGEKRYKTEIVGHQIKFLGSPKKEDEKATQSAQAPVPPTEEYDDLPF